MRRRGFSLLEVMVALAIFGLMISGILAAQAGLAASNKKAANMGQAINLSRCKMSEIEEKLLRDGYPEIDAIDTGVACCDTVEPAPFSCDTKVEKVTMPDPPSASSSSDGGGLPPGIGALMGGSDGGAPGANLDFDAGLQGLGAQVQGGGGGAEGMLGMVMGLVYPAMKPMMEASIRRVTVTVRWGEGPKPQEFSIVQYVTNPQRGGFIGASPVSSGAPASTLAPAPLGATPIVPFGGGSR